MPNTTPKRLCRFNPLQITYEQDSSFLVINIENSLIASYPDEIPEIYQRLKKRFASKELRTTETKQVSFENQPDVFYSNQFFFSEESVIRVETWNPKSYSKMQIPNFSRLRIKISTPNRELTSSLLETILS